MTKKIGAIAEEIYWHDSNLVVYDKNGKTIIKQTAIGPADIRKIFTPQIGNKLLMKRGEGFRDVHFDKQQGVSGSNKRNGAQTKRNPQSIPKPIYQGRSTKYGGRIAYWAYADAQRVLNAVKSEFPQARIVGYEKGFAIQTEISGDYLMANLRPSHESERNLTRNGRNFYQEFKYGKFLKSGVQLKRLAKQIIKDNGSFSANLLGEGFVTFQDGREAEHIGGLTGKQIDMLVNELEQLQTKRNPTAKRKCINCKKMFTPENDSQDVCSSKCFTAYVQKHRYDKPKRNPEQLNRGMVSGVQRLLQNTAQGAVRSANLCEKVIRKSTNISDFEKALDVALGAKHSLDSAIERIREEIYHFYQI